QLPSLVADRWRALPYDFLYGNIAADTSMAKKYAPVGRHCHAWHVGQEIFDLAPSDPLRAFGLGYLSHLAADTIAHNFFVPRQLVLTSSTVALGHSYWESRVEPHLGDPDAPEGRGCRGRRRAAPGSGGRKSAGPGKADAAAGAAGRRTSRARARRRDRAAAFRIALTIARLLETVAGTAPVAGRLGRGGELLLEDALRHFRICLPLRREHHLPHEERHQFRLAVPVPSDFRRVRAEHVRHPARDDV